MAASNALLDRFGSALRSLTVPRPVSLPEDMQKLGCNCSVRVNPAAELALQVVQ